MRTLTYLQTSLLTFFSLILWSQDTSTEREGGHLNNNKFKQLYEEFSTPIDTEPRQGPRRFLLPTTGRLCNGFGIG